MRIRENETMKLVTLTFLEGDEKCVERLLSELEVTTFSRLAVEGHERNAPARSVGWYGSAAPYRAEMILIFTEGEMASRILAGVEACTGVEDPKHPIRAFQLGVENAAGCGSESSNEAGGGQ